MPSFIMPSPLASVLRNYRKGGPLFCNELSLSPSHADDGELTHYIGMQRDVTERMELIRPLQKQKEDLQYDISTCRFSIILIP